MHSCSSMEEIQFKLLDISEAIGAGYRLATVEEVLEHAELVAKAIQHAECQTHNSAEELLLLLELDNEPPPARLLLRRGTHVDIQDHAPGQYFRLLVAGNRIRIKNGFIDKSTGLVWNDFASLFVTDKLAVCSCWCAPESLISADHDNLVALLFACLADDTEEAQEAIDAAGDHNIICRNHENVPYFGNALHLCAWKESEECLKLLLMHTNNCDTKAGSDGETALYLAALRGSKKCVKILAEIPEASNSINEQTKHYASSALMMAVWYQLHQVEMCKSLLQAPNIQLGLQNIRGNTAFHLATAYKESSPFAQPSEKATILKLMLEKCGCSVPSRLYQKAGWQKLSEAVITEAGESYRENSRYNNIVKKSHRNFINTPNKYEEIALHLALTHQVVPVQFARLLIAAGSDIKARDFNGQTALHKACSLQKDHGTVRMLRSCFFPDSPPPVSPDKNGSKEMQEWSDYACTRDSAGQTALHLAIDSGNSDAVEVLLDPTYNPKPKKLIHARGFDGKTTLHYAALSKASSPKDILSIVEKIFEYTKGTQEEKLLLWATGENVSVADEECENPGLKKLLRTKRKSIKDNILKISLDCKRRDMVIELINRGADFQNDDVKNSEDLKNLLKEHRGRTSDQPSSEDLLERQDLIKAIAALLINQHMGSPITLGIYGGLGMGKSSLMIQVQQHLLIKATREALVLDHSNIHDNNDFEGVKRYDDNIIKKRATCLKRELQKELQNVRKKEKRHNDCFLRKYVTKSLCTLKDLFSPCINNHESGDEDLASFLSTFRGDRSWMYKRLALANSGGHVPAVITVTYDAWQYESRDEAWAGLAVEILKEMESLMTSSQLLRAASIYYARDKKPSGIMIHLVLPILLAVCVGLIVIWLAIRLPSSFPQSPLLQFKFGFVPLSAFSVLWVVMRQILAAVKPVSERLVEYAKGLPDHHSKLGYQHKVIEDITFVREQLCQEPSWFWGILSWLWNFLSSPVRTTADAAAAAVQTESEALKRAPQKDNLRVVVFIDNLDRHKEQLFIPLNMILDNCDINAVVAINKGTAANVLVEKQSSQEESSVSNMNISHDGIVEGMKTTAAGEAFLTQLVQIPIVLPDPGVSELRDPFLSAQLKKIFRNEENIDQDTVDPDYNPNQSTGSPSNRVLCLRGWQNQRPPPHDRVLSVGTPGENEDGASTRRSQEDRNQNKESTYWSGIPINSLDIIYTESEIEMFEQVAKHTYGYYRSPRAWKQLLNYHRLVRSILTPNSKSLHIKAWKLQLIKWLFVCWQWRDEMNEIIKNWKKLVKLPEEFTLLLDTSNVGLSSIGIPLEEQLQILNLKQENNPVGKLFEEPKYSKIWLLYPSLKELVKKLQGFDNGQYKSALKDSKASNYDKDSKVTNDVEGSKATNNDEGSKATNADEGSKATNKDSVRKKSNIQYMQKFLENFNVTMQAIQAFQKFRFDCNSSYLDLPLDLEDTI